MLPCHARSVLLRASHNCATARKCLRRHLRQLASNFISVPLGFIKPEVPFTYPRTVSSTSASFDKINFCLLQTLRSDCLVAVWKRRNEAHRPFLQAVEWCTHNAINKTAGVAEADAQITFYLSLPLILTVFPAVVELEFGVGCRDHTEMGYRDSPQARSSPYNFNRQKGRVMILS